MFDILKKKLKKVVDSVSKKLEAKEEAAPKAEVEEVPKKFTGEVVGEKLEQVESEELIEPVAEKVEEKIEEPEKIVKRVEKKPFFKKIFERVVKKVTERVLSEEDLKPILDELEADLIEADVAVEVAEKIKSDLQANLVGKEIKRGKEKEIVVEVLRKSLLEILSAPEIDLEEIIKKAKSENRPTVLLFFGMNGVGKSLNLSKVANFLKNEGHVPILAAADTYRAAGDIQLEMYGEKIGVPVIKYQKGGDSCAVIFDAISSAKARGYDVVLGDTAGRMHTAKNLMDELAKIVRVNEPDIKILVLDSLTGSDVVRQFEFFDRAVGVDAIVFSKIDVNEKGGNILSVCYLFKRPILFLGTGQDFYDLTPYDPKKFVGSLIGMQTSIGM